MSINEHARTDLKELSQGINDFYGNLLDAMEAHAAAEEAVIDARQVLEEVVAVALAAGDVTGRNERERDGDARRQYGPLFDRLAAAERTERQAKLQLNLARVRVEGHRAQLRLLEVTSELLVANLI